MTFKDILDKALSFKLDVQKFNLFLKDNNFDIKDIVTAYDQAKSHKVNIKLPFIIFFEKIKCCADLVYFMKKYVKIQHQDRGIINFDTYPFQDKVLNELQTHDRTIILKSRQMGISTLVAAYSLWMMTFNEGKNILVLSIKQDTAKEVVTKVKLAWENLPSWLRLEALEKPALSLKLKNNSRILAASSDSDAARSFSASILILDEAAFIDNAEKVWTAAQQTLANVQGGKAIVLSTPNGVGQFFHQLWVDAELGKNGFNPIRLPWNLHPERDQEWRDKQTKELGEKRAAQECDTDFLTSGDTVISMQILEEYRNFHVVEPLERRGVTRDYWMWDYPRPGKSYIVACDVARGDAEDYSTIQVLDVETVTQVAEFQGKIPPKEFGVMAMLIAMEWNKALLVIERESAGFAALQPAIDDQYPNLFYSSPDPQKYVDVQHQLKNKYYSDEKKLVPGIGMTLKVRPLVVSKLESYFRLKEVEVKSIRLIEELTTFIWQNHKPVAMEGRNDDLVMAMCIGLWVRDTALRLRTEGIELVKTMINQIQSTGDYTMPIQTSAAKKAAFDSWHLKGPRGEIESLEWLIR